VTRAVSRLIFDDFTYEERRGRESNPRIAVLQTATLPLGYPADLRKRTISLSLRLYQLAKVSESSAEHRNTRVRRNDRLCTRSTL
jgi:hypothetical protein